jgi:hypothetical protein
MASRIFEVISGGLLVAAWVLAAQVIYYTIKMRAA